jgi:hypothetical protein
MFTFILISRNYVNVETGSELSKFRLPIRERGLWRHNEVRTEIAMMFLYVEQK